MGLKNSGMSRRDFLAGVGGAAVGLGLGLSGCKTNRAAKTNKRPNLLFFFSDQQRRHSLGFMGEDPVLTPNVDKFAAESLVLNNAVSAYPVCGPYRGTLMTGRYPHSTGITKNGKGLRLSEQCFGQQLKGAGYRTGYIGKWHLYDNGIDDWREWHFCEKGQFVPKEHRFGFDFWHVANCNHRTFWKLYYEDGQEPVLNEGGWQVEHEVDVATEFLRGQRGAEEPFALFVSVVPPHNTHGPGFEPYVLNEREAKRPELYRTQYHAPEEYEALYEGKDLERRANVPGDAGEIALPGYFGACTGVDDHFGRLLRFLEDEGLAEDTIVVYTADHGEMMGSHGRFQKSVWYEESIGIPFIIRWPAGLRTGDEDVLLNSVDVMPTLLGLMGVEVPAVVEGQDLSGVLKGESAEKPGSAFTQCGNWRGIRTGQYTFVADFKGGKADMFMYDNEADPYQMRQFREGDVEGEVFEGLKAELGQWLVKTGDPFAGRI